MGNIDVRRQGLLAAREMVQEVSDASLSAATRRADAADWEEFERWCAAADATALPASSEMVAAYLVTHSRMISTNGKPRYATSTLRRWLTGINAVHIRAGLPCPTADACLSAVMSGIPRERSSAQRRVEPLRRDDIYQIIASMDLRQWPIAVADIRDTAVLPLGYTRAFRRSELVDLRMNDIASRAPTDCTFGCADPRPTGRAAVRSRRSPTVAARPATCPCCAVAMAEADRGRRDARSTVPIWSSVLVVNTDTHICRDASSPDPDDKRAVFRPVRNTGAIGAEALSGHAVGVIVKSRAASGGPGPGQVFQDD